MIISRTPLRISFVGGGTDYKEYYKHGHGAVVSTTINKYVYVILKPWFSRQIRVSYSTGEIVDSVAEVKHNIIREAMRLTGVNGGLEIAYVGDIPIGSVGTGLAASSALTVGILNALYFYKGEKISPARLAIEAYRVEREILGQAGGKQDQYAVAYGGLNHIKFNKDETVTVKKIEMSKEAKKRLNRRLLAFYTGMATESDKVSSEQKEKASENHESLGQMVQFTHELQRFLRKGKLEELGRLLHENWLLKKKLASRITNSNIDDYYSKALGAGALGGKILGSGGGGFLLFYCPEENQNSVRNALSDLKEMPFIFESDGSKIIRI